MTYLPDRKILLPTALLLAALVALATWLGQPDNASAGGEQAVPSEAYETVTADGSVELIVNVRNSDVLSDVVATLRSRGRGAAADRLEQLFSARIESLVQRLPVDVVVEERYEHLGGVLLRVSTPEALRALNSLPNVLSIGVPEVVEPLLTQSLALINQPEAAAAGYEGTGSSVAVLDTGVDYLHPDFGSCNVGGVNCRVKFVDDFTDTPGSDGDGYVDNSRDDSGHGTNVSGIIAGVAPGTGILGLDVFRKDLGNPSDPNSCWGKNCASDVDLMAAIEWILSNVTTYDTKAVNMSLGGSWNSLCPTNLQPSFQSLLAAGVLPVVASGNDGSLDKVSYPGCIPESHTVGAVYDADGGGVQFSNCTDFTRVEDKVTCFSNSNDSMLDSLAPGGAITAAGITMYGTSQATPHVAGAAAVLGAIEGVTISAVEDALKTTGPLITDHRNGVQKHRLDLEAAVAAVGGQPAGNPVALTAAQTQDKDRDGKIDRVKLIFAESVNDNFSGLSVAVDGYQVQGFVTGKAGDAVVFALLAEKSSPDSGSRPLVTLVSNNSLGSSSALVGPAGSSITAVDKAGPVILSAQTKTARVVVVNFSEAMKAFTVKAADFKLTIGGTVRTIAKVVKVDDDTWEIVVQRSSRWASGVSGTVQLVAVNVVKDSSGVKSKNTSPVTVAAVF